MYSLLPYNTFGIDVSANRFIEYASVEELKTLIEQGAVTTPFCILAAAATCYLPKTMKEWCCTPVSKESKWWRKTNALFPCV